MDDQNTPSAPVDDATTLSSANSPDLATTAVEPVSDQTTGSDTPNTPPMAPESPINAPSTSPVGDQNPPINQPESDGSEQPISAPNEPEAPVDDQPVSEPIQSSQAQSVPVPAPTAQTPIVEQTQPSAQQNQTSFIRALLAKANAKLGSNRQKKLDKVMQLAQKKGFITNEQAQDLLHCSDATATRYLSKLVQQGRLNRTDGSHWVKYLFVR
jgi:hypothetical protein